MPKLNSIQRAQVIADIQDGIPIRDVAHIMNTSKNTVQKIKCRWEIEEMLEKKKVTTCKIPLKYLPISSCSKCYRTNFRGS